MSTQALGWALRVPDLTAPTHRTLIMLADTCSAAGSSTVSTAELVVLCGNVNPSTLRRHLSELEARGLISRVTQYRADGSQTGNRFTLHHPRSKMSTPPLKNEHPLTGDLDSEARQRQKNTATLQLPLTPPSTPPLPEYPFSALKDAYPARQGAQNWTLAEKRFCRLAPIDRALAIKGATAYSADLAEAGKVGTVYVMQASRFLNASNRVWDEYLAIAEAKTGRKSRTRRRLPADYNTA